MHTIVPKQMLVGNQINLKNVMLLACWKRLGPIALATFDERVIVFF